MQLIFSGSKFQRDGVENRKARLENTVLMNSWTRSRIWQINVNYVTVVTQYSLQASVALVRVGVGYKMVWVRVSSRYELVRVRLGIGYELAGYELEWVRVDWKPCILPVGILPHSASRILPAP